MNVRLCKLRTHSLVVLWTSAILLISSASTLRGQGCYLVQPGGLIGWWRAEGNANDSAGAWTGTLVNGVSFVPGKVGLGFALSGNPSLRSPYVELPANLFPYPTSGSGNAPFSFELWFSTSTGGVILGQQNAAPFVTPSAYIPAIYVGTDGRLYVTLFWDQFARIISPGAVNDGGFHHVAVTYDGTTETVYLDGTALASQPFTQLAYATTYYYQLGAGYTAGWPAGNGGWFAFDGIIDEASLYNRALAPSEVAGIFAAGSSGKCPLNPGLPPEFLAQPTNTTVALGGNATFTATGVSTTGLPPNYQWQFNGQNLANSTHYVGVTSNTLTIVNAGPSDVGSYRVVLFDSTGTNASRVVSLSLLGNCTPAPPGLVAWYKAEGNAVDSAGSHDGTEVNGVGVWPGEVGNGFALSGSFDYVALPLNLFPYPTSGEGNASFSFETWFSCTMSGGPIGGVILGQQDTTPFNKPDAYVPAIYVGTDGKLYVAMFWDQFARFISPGTVTDGQFHHVAVTYDGTTEVVYLDGAIIGSGPFTQVSYASIYYYQLGTGYTAGLWPAANNGWFSFHGIIDEASIYNRALTTSEISGIFAAGGSGKCPVSSGPPQIIAQPASQTVLPGANASFSVTATGSAPLSYQWKASPTLSGGVNLVDSSHYSGTTNSTLTISNVGSGDLGHYFVVISNPSGSVTSAPATLSVAQVSCTPPPPGLLAWYKAEGNPSDSADSMPASTANAVTYAPGKVGLGFQFPGGNGFVQLPPNLFPYPTSGNSGNAPFSFETWFSTTTGGVILGQQEGDSTGYPFATPNAFVPAIYVGHDGRLYVMMFWSYFSQVISPTTVNDGAFHHVAVTYDGTTEVVYLDGTMVGSRYMTQLGYAANYYYELGTGFTSGWPQGNPGWFPFTGIIDEASVYGRALNSSEVAAIFAASSGGKCTSATNGTPQITTQPASQTVALGTTASFSVVATGTAPLSYQWQLNGQNLVGNTHYVGTTSNVLTIAGVAPVDIGNYRVIVSNGGGSVTSATAALAAQGCTPAPPGLIAWYKAEGNAADSADSHPGTLVNNVGFRAGPVGLGFVLGAGAYVALPPNLFPYPTTGSGNAPFSFETWFGTLAGGFGGVILGQQDTTPFYKPDAYMPAVYVGTDGKLYVAMFWDQFNQIVSPGIVNDGAYHHVAVTYDGTTETVYLDGAVIGSAPFTQLAYASTYYYQLGTGYTAGLWPAANGDWFSFSGIIDEASIYDRALSASEVFNIVAAGSNGKCP